MKAKVTIITVMVVMSMVLFSELPAWSYEEAPPIDILPDFTDTDVQIEPIADIDTEEEEAPVEDSSSRVSIGLKMAYHLFWSQGLLAHGEDHGLPNLTANDLSGPGIELDVDFDWGSYLILSMTVGAYQGISTENNIDLYTAYGLGTVKIINRTQYADYYTGLGLGVYYGNMEAGDTVDSLKPGVHVLVGIRIPLTSQVSLLLEDRVAFSQKAKGGFKDMNLGGNFALLGCSYHF